MASRVASAVVKSRGVGALFPFGRNLFQVLGNDAAWGVGSKVTRSMWSHFPECYWTVTRVVPATNGKGQAIKGKAYGVLTWRGLSDGRETRIRGALKKQWDVQQ